MPTKYQARSTDQNWLLRSKPEQAPNTQETGSSVYIYLAHDLAYQQRNVHAQSPH